MLQTKPSLFTVTILRVFDNADCNMVKNILSNMITKTFYRKWHHPAQLRRLRQVHHRLRKLRLQSSYLKCFKVLCHILGGVGKSYNGHVIDFCFLQRYKSKRDKIKLAVLKHTMILFASCYVLNVKQL